MGSRSSELKRSLRTIKGRAGFTLMEVLVTAGIAGSLAAVAFPSLSTAVQAHRLTAGVRSTIGYIRVARSSAVTRSKQAQVVLSAGNTTLSVQVAPVGTTSWVTIGTPLVLDGGVTVSSVSPANGIVFDQLGRVSNGSSAVTVTLQNARGGTRQVTVSFLGGVDIS